MMVSSTKTSKMLHRCDYLMLMVVAATFLCHVGNVMGFTIASSPPSLSKFQLDAAKVGIFFGTSTGSTEDVAERIASEFGASDVDVDGPFDIEALDGSLSDTFGKICINFGL